MDECVAKECKCKPGPLRWLRKLKENKKYLSIYLNKDYLDKRVNSHEQDSYSRMVIRQ